MVSFHDALLYTSHTQPTHPPTHRRYGMKGRLGVQATLLFFESALLLWFSYAM
jgi:hypothetical protein